MKYLELDGRRYAWKDILARRKAQRQCERHASQPALFDLVHDARPKSQASASNRFSEPTLFDT
jgi:hypothetical protein